MIKERLIDWANVVLYGQPHRTAFLSTSHWFRHRSAGTVISTQDLRSFQTPAGRQKLEMLSLHHAAAPITISLDDTLVREAFTAQHRRVIGDIIRRLEVPRRYILLYWQQSKRREEFRSYTVTMELQAEIAAGTNNWQNAKGKFSHEEQKDLDSGQHSLHSPSMRRSNAHLS